MMPSSLLLDQRCLWITLWIRFTNELSMKKMDKFPPVVAKYTNVLFDSKSKIKIMGSKFKVFLAVIALFAIATFQLSKSPVSVQRSRSPVVLLFLGDSLTRYQYLDFTYWLHHHRNWSNLSPLPLIWELNHEKWIKFFLYVDEVFEGSMTCDCHRSATFECLNPSINTTTFSLGRQDIDSKTGQCVLTIVENRRYQHPSLPITAYYFSLFGDHPVTGRYPIDAIPRGNSTFADNATLNLLFAADLHIMAQTMLPKLHPTHIVLNAGLWSTTFLLPHWNDTAASLEALTPNIIWRSTTSVCFYGNITKIASEDLENLVMRDYVGRNASPWSISPAPTVTCSDYVDAAHFRAGAYRAMNEALWSTLERLTPSLQRL